jgi:uncharacterized membrane protein YfcA
MTTASLICLGLLSGVGAGLLAGLIGIGGGIVVVPVVYYGLVSSGVLADHAAHVAVSTSLAAILPAAIVSSLGHWRAGNTDFAFLRDWGPGIAVGLSSRNSRLRMFAVACYSGCLLPFVCSLRYVLRLPGGSGPS